MKPLKTASWGAGCSLAVDASHGGEPRALAKWFAVASLLVVYLSGIDHTQAELTAHPRPFLIQPDAGEHLGRMPLFDLVANCQLNGALHFTHGIHP